MNNPPAQRRSHRANPHEKFVLSLCALGSTMEGARTVLAEFLRDEASAFIPCDRRALDSAAITSPRKSADIYLADLATARGWQLVTLDAGIAHPAADLIPELAVQP
jgi:hypothetical protein